MALSHSQLEIVTPVDHERKDAVTTPQSESEWIDGLCGGDEECYVRLVHAYSGKLLTVSRRYLNEEDARDAVQEAFIKSFDSIGSFRRGSSLSTWLHRIVINCCLGMLRKSKAKMEVSIESLLPSFLEDGHRANPTDAWPEECLERLNTSSLISKSLGKIPEDYRLVILLRDIEGLSGEETAIALGISINLVKVRLHRARQALREQLDPIVHGECSGKQ